MRSPIDLTPIIDGCTPEVRTAGHAPPQDGTDAPRQGLVGLLARVCLPPEQAEKIRGSRYQEGVIAPLAVE